MPSATTSRINVREVGPRDGLQSIKSTMPTAEKIRWIGAMVEAGVREMEVASFVPAATMPQMADGAEVVRSIRAEHPNLHAVALAPNLRGATAAAAAGAQAILIPVSASEAHSRSNVHRGTAEQVNAVADIVTYVRALDVPPRIEGGISTAFGCSIQGAVPEGDVIDLAVALVEAGVDTVMLADTLGYATPSRVKRLVRAVRNEVGAERLGHLHLHDTFGTALANVYAALEEGVRGFDSAARGLGGCPYAPGAAGNVATEDLVYLLESEGFSTGIDLPAFIAAGANLQTVFPDEKLYSRVASAGIPRTFHSSHRTIKV
jgi:isopropylmalate/homocitrate/citramalate synthase